MELHAVLRYYPKAMVNLSVLFLQHLPKVEIIRAVAAVVGAEEGAPRVVEVGGQLTRRLLSKLGV